MSKTLSHRGSEAGSKSDRKARRSKRHLMLLVFVMVVIVGVAAFFGGDKDSGSTANNDESKDVEVAEIVQNTVDIGEDETVLGESVVDEEVVAEQAEKDDKGEIKDQGAAKKRDEQRMKDMEKVRDAMDKYYKDNKAYPDDMQRLVPKYMDSAPSNPTPGGVEYTITGIGAEITPGSDTYAYYDMVYALEVGVKDLESGIHVANPDGIALP